MTSHDDTQNHFRYVVTAARRARQLQNGSQPLVDSQSNKACRIAQDEIAAGKVKSASAMVEPLELSPEIQQDTEV